MQIATVHESSAREKRPDGQMYLVDTVRQKALPVPMNVALHLRDALERWHQVLPELERITSELRNGGAAQAVPLQGLRFTSPLPRSFSFLDGSAYLSHVRRVRQSRGAEMPAELREIPLMYQGVSAPFLDPEQEIAIVDESFGYDFEAELAVVTDEVPLGTTAEEAHKHLKLLLLLNDLSLRNLVPAELSRGFGFLQSKPSSSCAPIAITPDELGAAWRDGIASIRVEVTLNGTRVGNLATSEMHFSFPQLLEHAARTRALPAGSIIGSGTVSNEDEQAGIGCLVEQRVLEIIRSGGASTPYLKVGDAFTIEAFLGTRSLFGRIAHRCIAA